MVSITTLINSGLLLVGKWIYQGLATHQQVAEEQYNIIRFLGGSAPYIQSPGYGISTDFPMGCTIEQVQLLSRHGERYPTLNKGNEFEKVLEKLLDHSQEYKGSMAFLNDYEYFVTDKSQYALETTPENSEGTYAGTTNAFRHGAYFRNRYDTIFNSSQELPVFTTNSKRVFNTAEIFTQGFLGEEYSRERVKYNIFAESEELGVNSLTPRYACTTYNKDANSDLVTSFSKLYLTNILARLNEENPFLTIDEDDVKTLFDFCAYELNVKSTSSFCDLFTTEDFAYYGYDNDLDKYYSSGPGNNMSAIIGSVYLNASLNLLKDNSNPNKIWLSFTHDTDIDHYISALGIFTPERDLPLDRVDFERQYYHAYLVPQGARFYTEKLKCGEDTFVRYVINDSVQPIPQCQNGPGFSCEISEYESFVKQVLQSNSIAGCRVSNHVDKALTFFWDYQSRNYTADLEL
ncbi:histidine phosphatase superfamily [Scheffersomyces amazonensis]|uniref:histidine phosphatase superfamily n=1 Tax=Scheffersomyces amazonensis TaxID=1078765 RepID=UPI00315DE819